ncbi:hypothetical protein ROZALSC1DRAFT_26691 [Rozella allomycis CSF55]|uniref:CLASP N-terminal domain-containing protein n=1 Tax=Rozella allomycis (strain CSF55) TaxID=988480 RepID=A0A4V1J0L0_ROZAC|nr:hypothetical protein ROZALSC1DRAFT_26691 [Rozella allomycis CSF55]
MSPGQDLLKIEKVISQKETEHTWQQIDNSIKSLSKICKERRDPDSFLQFVKKNKEILILCLSTERTRLSGTTVELLTDIIQTYGLEAEAAIECFIPTLLKLCTRANKVFISRSSKCLEMISVKVGSPKLLQRVKEASLSTNKGLRLISVGLATNLLQHMKHPEVYVSTFEEIIKSSLDDASADNNFEMNAQRLKHNLSSNALKYLGVEKKPLGEKNIFEARLEKPQITKWPQQNSGISTILKPENTKGIIHSVQSPITKKGLLGKPIRNLESEIGKTSLNSLGKASRDILFNKVSELPKREHDIGKSSELGKPSRILGNSEKRPRSVLKSVELQPLIKTKSNLEEERPTKIIKFHSSPLKPLVKRPQMLSMKKAIKPKMAERTTFKPPFSIHIWTFQVKDSDWDQRRQAFDSIQNLTKEEIVKHKPVITKYLLEGLSDSHFKSIIVHWPLLPMREKADVVLSKLALIMNNHKSKAVVLVSAETLFKLVQDSIPEDELVRVTISCLSSVHLPKYVAILIQHIQAIISYDNCSPEQFQTLLEKSIQQNQTFEPLLPVINRLYEKDIHKFSLYCGSLFDYILSKIGKSFPTDATNNNLNDPNESIILVDGEKNNLIVESDVEFGDLLNECEGSIEVEVKDTLESILKSAEIEECVKDVVENLIDGVMEIVSKEYLQKTLQESNRDTSIENVVKEECIKVVFDKESKEVDIEDSIECNNDVAEEESNKEIIIEGVVEHDDVDEKKSIECTKDLSEECNMVESKGDDISLPFCQPAVQQSTPSQDALTEVNNEIVVDEPKSLVHEPSPRIGFDILEADINYQIVTYLNKIIENICTHVQREIVDDCEASYLASTIYDGWINQLIQ